MNTGVNISFQTRVFIFSGCTCRTARSYGNSSFSFLRNLYTICWRMFKLLYNCAHLTWKQEMLKNLQARLQQYGNQELPDVKVRFRKGRGTRDQTANICWIIEKVREFKKSKSTSASLTTQKPLTVWIISNHVKFLKRWEYQTLTCFLRNLYVGQEATLELGVEQWSGSKLGKEYINTVYCHCAYLTSM